MSISFESFRHSHRNDIFNIRFRGHSRASRLKVNIAHRARICPLTPCRSYLHVCQFPLVERRKQQFHASLAGCVGSVKKDTTRDSSAAVTSDLVPVSPLFFFFFFVFLLQTRPIGAIERFLEIKKSTLRPTPRIRRGNHPIFSNFVAEYYIFGCAALRVSICFFSWFFL